MGEVESGDPANMEELCCPYCDQPFSVCECDKYLDFQEEDEPTVYFAQRAPSPEGEICKYFMAGNCRFGDYCRNLHPVAIQYLDRGVPEVKNPDDPQTQKLLKALEDTDNEIAQLRQQLEEKMKRRETILAQLLSR